MCSSRMLPAEAFSPSALWGGGGGGGDDIVRALREQANAVIDNSLPCLRGSPRKRPRSLGCNTHMAA